MLSNNLIIYYTTMEYIKRVRKKWKTVGRPSKAEIAMKEFMNRELKENKWMEKIMKSMLNKIKYWWLIIRTGREENIK